MKAWILNFAVKNPAIEENSVVAKIAMSKAKTTLSSTGIPSRLMKCPNNVEGRVPSWSKKPTHTLPNPSSLPTERSVPPNTMSPATPNVKKIRDEALSRYPEMFSQVRMLPEPKRGEAMKQAIKKKATAIYKALLINVSFKEKE